MEIFNIGPFELLLILVIAFVLLGPKDMILTAYRIGKWIREMIRSPMWRDIIRQAQEIRELPQKLIDETGLKQEIDSIKQEAMLTYDEVRTELKSATEGAELKVDVNEVFQTPPGSLSTGSSPVGVLPQPDLPSVDQSTPAQPENAILPPVDLPTNEETSFVAEVSTSANEMTSPADEVSSPAETAPPPAEPRPVPVGVQVGLPIVLNKPAAQVQPVEPVAPADVVVSAVESPAKPARKKAAPRKRSQPAVEVTPIDVASLEVAAPDLDGSGLHGDNGVSAEDAPAKPVKKRAVRKKAVEEVQPSSGE
jgi:sec-independent protein translocase protein TatB